MEERSRSEIMRGELIGLPAIIIEAKNPTNVGIKGVIKNETKFTLTINNKMVFKKNIVIKIDGINVPGLNLVNRPAERIKVNV